MEKLANLFLVLIDYLMKIGIWAKIEPGEDQKEWKRADVNKALGEFQDQCVRLSRIEIVKEMTRAMDVHVDLGETTIEVVYRQLLTRIDMTAQSLEQTDDLCARLSETQNDINNRLAMIESEYAFYNQEIEKVKNGDHFVQAHASDPFKEVYKGYTIREDPFIFRLDVYAWGDIYQDSFISIAKAHEFIDAEVKKYEKPKSEGNLKHPTQPIYKDAENVDRFKKNEIVRYLLDSGPNDLDHLAKMPFHQTDWIQFYQLIGYSLSAFEEIYIEAIDSGWNIHDRDYKADCERLETILDLYFTKLYASTDRDEHHEMHEQLTNSFKSYQKQRGL